MTKQELAAKTAAALEALYPDAVCSLEYEDEPWKLLILARLSAQCTDARVNIVAKTLFWRFPTPESVADCDLAALEAVDLAVVAVGAEPRVDLVQPRADVGDHGAERPRGQVVGQVDADGRTHDLFDVTHGG